MRDHEHVTLAVMGIKHGGDCGGTLCETCKCCIHCTNNACGCEYQGSCANADCGCAYITDDVIDVTAFAKYEVDCPACGNPHDVGDFNPDGQTFSCEYCKQVFRVVQVV